MFARIIFSLLIVISLNITIAIQAQTLTIEYGETVTGEITHEQTAITYRFEGLAGQIIGAEMLSKNRELDNPLETPVLLLRAPNESIIADSTLAFTLDDAFFIVELPTDGSYFLTATRDGSVPAPAVGEFTLTLRLVQELSADVPFSSSIANDEFGQYVLVRPEVPFSIGYTRIDGSFSPRISVNEIITRRDGLQPVGQISGSGVTQVQLGVFEPGQPYIVMISPGFFSFAFRPTFADYELRLHLHSPE